MQLLENTGHDEGKETTEQLLEITGIRSLINAAVWLETLFAIVGRVSNPTECDR